MLKRIFHLLMKALIVFVVVQLTMFGWRFWSADITKLNIANDDLSNSLRNHVYMLSHKIGYRSVRQYDNLIKTQNYIYEQFVSFGYDVSFQSYHVSGKKVNNIIASKKGIIPTEKTIILGAHYDSCDNPGADDNASAVAGLLEIARALSQAQTNKTIEFVAFVNEEPPFFQTEQMGSRVYVKALKDSGKDIEVAVVLEMLGYYSEKWFSQRYPPIMGMFYPNKANFITVVGNGASRISVNKFHNLFKRHSQFPVEKTPAFDFIPCTDFSDHWSFWKEGYSAIMITDTAFFRNKNYHKKTDTYETLNYQHMSSVVKGITEVLKNY